MKVQRNERGQTTIVFAVFLALVFLGMGALAIDVGILYRQKRMVQAAADAAAIAASAQYGTTDINTSAKAAAQQQAGGILSGDVTATLKSAATSDVQVVVTHSAQTYFLSMVNSAWSNINVSALGEAAKPPSNSCLNSLAPAPGVTSSLAPVYYCASGSSGGIISGNSSTIKTTGCGICSNSPVIGCAYGGTISTDSSVNAGGAGVEGNVTASGGTSKAGNCSDPYSSLTKPTPASACIDPTWMTGATSAGGGPEAIYAGTYCNFNTANVSTLTMNPGIYIVKTTFSTNSASVINGTGGVTIYLAPGAIADATNSTYVAGGAMPYGVGNGTTMNITAPAAGSTAGVAIWDDSGASSATPDNFSFGGGAGTTINGAIYAPHGIIVDGNAAGVAAVNGGITAWAIATGSSGTLSVTNSGGGAAAGKVTLIQ